MATKTIQIECEDCGGTGLYEGMCEAPGCAVICLGCGGAGWATFVYKEFVRRKGRRGIKLVSASRGASLITGVGASGPQMTYQEFQKDSRFKPIFKRI